MRSVENRLEGTLGQGHAVSLDVVQVNPEKTFLRKKAQKEPGTRPEGSGPACSSRASLYIAPIGRSSPHRGTQRL